MSNKWLAERRNFFVKNLIKEFIETYFYFNELYQRFLATKQLPFADISQLVGSEARKGALWHLKDSCHKLWRKADPHDDLNASLFDWVIGSIFHEAMKLKEDVYMVENYSHLITTVNGHRVPPANQQFWRECRKMMNKTEAEVAEHMEKLGLLFGRASYLLRAMIPARGHNTLLVRFLIEKQAAVEQLWGETLSSILGEMFPGGLDQAYCAAGRSYREGQWHEDALRAYTQALAINSECSEARREISKIEARPDRHRTQPADRAAPEAGPGRGKGDDNNTGIWIATS